MNGKFVLEYAWVIPVLPVVAFAVIGLFLHKQPKLAAGVSIAAIATGFVLSAGIAREVYLAGPEAVFSFSAPWLAVQGLAIKAGVMIDPLTAVMLVVVTSIALLVQIYSLGYMRGDPGLSRYYAYQSLFVGSMLGLLVADNFGQLFVFWELVGACSYLLIGFWFGRVSAREAAKKAFITTRVGDFGFLLGVIILQYTFGTLDFTALTAEIEVFSNTALITVVTLLLFVGPVGKSAQFPLHVWLPDAMEGPTPVSALIHAATMVAAGVYFIARAFTIFHVAPDTMQVVAYIGGFTAIFAASIALVQNDIKRILAYSTISQLGYMVMALGVGSMTAGIFHLTTHAFFKSLLFLGAGSVIVALHEEQDIWKMGGLGKKMPVTTLTFIIGALALAGVPPLSGFWSKDEILLGAYASGNTGLYVIGSLVAFMTAFYMFRLIFVAFFGKNTGGESAKESPAVMTLPLIVLALISIVAGFLGSPLTDNAFGQFITARGNLHVEPSTMIMAISSVLALLGIFLAYLIYQRGIISPQRIKEKFALAYQVLEHKFYMDEFYAWFTAKFVDAVAAVMFWIDLHIVNGFVNALAFGTGKAGKILRLTEDGQVQTYALYMVTGLVIILVLGITVVFAEILI